MKPTNPSTVELSIVMPCLNEAGTLGTCVTKALETMKSLGIQGEVIVADNGSEDGSRDLARSLGARVVPVARRGYGSAVKTGCEAASGRFIIMGDADDSYDFREIGSFVEKLRSGQDLVMGTRLKGTILPGAMPWKNRYIGNPALSAMLRWLFRVPVSDAHCGMRGFSKSAFERMAPRTPGMEFASEMVIRAAKLGLRITEVPITFHPDGRSRAPHLRPWRDGWRHVKLMLMFSPTALFLVPGLALLLLGLGLAVAQLFAPPTQPLIVLGFRLDFHWAILGGLLAMVGYQVITVHFFARVYSVTHRIREVDPLLARAFRFLTLPRVLLASTIVIAGGLILTGVAVAHWLQAGFGPLVTSYTRLFILGATLLALGLQTFFNAFFFSILGDAYRYGDAASVADAAVDADTPEP